MLRDLNRAWRRVRSVMVQMPTGPGKTHLMAEAIRQTLSSPDGGGGVLIVAHRRELIEQIKATLNDFGIDRRRERVYVESIQKLSKHVGEADYEPRLVIVDEAHHALARTYRMLWERWPEARFLGLTATPCRLSGEPFTDLFDVLLQSWSIRKFVRRGYLSDMEYVSVRSDSVFLQKVAGLSKRGTDGDYQTREMANVLDTPESIEHLYYSYRKYAGGKKGIVYAINRDHARHIAAYYRRQGLDCEVIDSRTPARERERLVAQYRSGAGTDVLVNVDIFSEGFDVPEVEFIQLARPTLSLSKFLQQLGRGMRVSEGKEKVTILDQVGLYLIFGLPTAERDWQGMFSGELRGMGTPFSQEGFMTWADGLDKVLVNEEMFRIGDFIERDGRAVEVRSRRGTRRPAETYGKARLSIFREGGLYGIRRGATVSCPPLYAKIEMLGGRSKYFALAQLPREKTGGTDRWTVISKEGEDLKASMTGEYISQVDGVFEYRARENGRFVIYLHDVDNHVTFTDMRLDRIGGLQFFRSFRDGTSILRGTPACRRVLRGGDDVVYNSCLAIIGDDLFVKTDGNRQYRIAGFLGDSVIVRQGRGLLQIGKDGSCRQTYRLMPPEATEHPDLKLLGLKKEKILGFTGNS